ncbi:MAG: hypothetical protein EAZ13_03810 [Sphingobacteriia bacterium]|nr:MAG: hypothetical protein EAZ13_03810 [Sphingobacteriia bacterium]
MYNGRVMVSNGLYILKLLGGAVYLRVGCNHMRQLLFIITFTLTNIYCFCQRQDTLFLKRSLYVDTPYNYTIYHAIYIDSNYATSGLKYLVDFSFGQFDSTTYFEGLKNLTKNKFHKHSLSKQFPRKWIALYKYKKNFYTYHPSDFGNHCKFQITDTTTMDFTMEGPEPSLILSAKQISSNNIEIIRKNYWQGNRLTINIIDTTRGVAIFTFAPTKYRPYSYKRLMVSADKAKIFKTIVNYCPTDKMYEFDFDKIDFEQLEKNGYSQH